MWLRSLLRTPNSRSRLQKRRRSVAFRPQVEPLEDRTTPAILSPTDQVANPPSEEAARDVTVMTRNLYVGADISPVAAALASGSPSAIINATSTIWAGVLSTSFPERAEALAEEIVHAQPLLIGLQEVALFRTGAPDSFFGNPTQADHVEFDYLAILLAELDERGLHYAPVAVTQNLDAESTGFVAPGVLRDIRLTDRDVILARSDLPASELKLSNVRTANFATNLSIPIGDTGEFFTNLHGWGAVDARVRGKAFRFINTHLEVESANPFVNAIQVAQANELLAGPASTSLPVILVGDFNSRADGTGTATYSRLLGAGFGDVWSTTHPNELGNTFGHDADLRNTTVNFTRRLDLVLYRGDLRALGADVVGDELGDRTPSGLWPSDHGGVAATLGIHIRPRWHGAEPLAVSGVQPLLTQALDRWQAAGAATSGLNTLASQITALRGTTLGPVSGDILRLDATAAGWGWFVDPTPEDDSVCIHRGDQGEMRHTDLFTVPTHEIGYALGQGHDDGVTQETLAVGSRLALGGDANAFFAPLAADGDVPWLSRNRRRG